MGSAVNYDKHTLKNVNYGKQNCVFSKKMC